MAAGYVSTDVLYKIFTESKIMELKKPKPSKAPAKKSKQIGLSPLTRQILEATSPESRAAMLRDIRRDDDEIQKQLEIEMLEDPDYLENLENNKLGFYMEQVIAFYGACPVCNAKTLRNYASPFIPVVDVICVNKSVEGNTAHSNQTRFFQIKLSVGESKYFSPKYVCVGSRRYGQNSHVVDIASHDITKNVVVGYICINVTRNEEANTCTINYDIDKSFILLPQLKKVGIVGTYYNYIAKKVHFFKNAIKWNQDAVTRNSLRSCIEELVINTGIIFNETVEPNPFGPIKLGERLIFDTEVKDESKEEKKDDTYHSYFTRSKTKRPDDDVENGVEKKFKKGGYLKKYKLKI